MMPNPLPYTMQDSYGDQVEELTFVSVLLENEFLRAEFLPGVGGRLWSLYDKKARRELLLNNTMFIPGNFALRNAWVPGGVEWNIGHLQEPRDRPPAMKLCVACYISHD